MKATIIKPEKNVVECLRQIRDEISNEIKDMTFTEERTFLDNLLRDGKKKYDNQKSGANATKIR